LLETKVCLLDFGIFLNLLKDFLEKSKICWVFSIQHDSRPRNLQLQRTKLAKHTTNDSFSEYQNERNALLQHSSGNENLNILVSTPIPCAEPGANQTMTREHSPN
jgi:hypothetical protein